MGRKSVYHDEITKDYEFVREDNKILLNEFIDYCKSNDKSPQTIKQYEHWLKIFFSWNYAHNQDKFYIDLKKRDFTRYLGYLRDLDFSSNRIAALKSVLSAFSNEIDLMYQDEYPNFRNQLRGLEPVHISTVREKTVMSKAEVDETLKKLVEKGYYQEACYLALVCASGARKSELLQMKVSFFTDNNLVFDGYMYMTPLIRTKGRGKAGKSLKKYIIKDIFKPYLDLWLNEREQKNIQNEYLFVTKKGSEYCQATTSTANTIASKISDVAGIDFYTHSGRHYFCTMLKRMNFPDDIVVQIYGWADASMMKIYNDIPAEEVLNDFFKGFNKDVEGDE